MPAQHSISEAIAVAIQARQKLPHLETLPGISPEHVRGRIQGGTLVFACPALKLVYITTPKNTEDYLFGCARAFLVHNTSINQMFAHKLLATVHEQWDLYYDSNRKHTAAEIMAYFGAHGYQRIERGASGPLEDNQYYIYDVSYLDIARFNVVLQKKPADDKRVIDQFLKNWENYNKRYLGQATMVPVCLRDTKNWREASLAALKGKDVFKVKDVTHALHDPQYRYHAMLARLNDDLVMQHYLELSKKFYGKFK